MGLGWEVIRAFSDIFNKQNNKIEIQQMDVQELGEEIPNVEIGLLPQIIPLSRQNSIDSTVPIPNSLQYYLQKFASRLKIPLTRTTNCNHRGSCICSCLVHSTTTGLISYLIKVAISMVLSVKKIRKNPKTILMNFVEGDTIKFGLFIFLFLLGMRAIICGLRRKVKQDCSKYVFLLAGLVGGTASAYILPKKMRQTIALFLLARAFDITYRSLVQKKYLPEFTYFYPVLYGFMMFITGGFGFALEPAALSPDLHRFYQYFTSETPSDQQMRRIWIERHNMKLLRKGYQIYDVFEYLPKAKVIYQREVLNKK